MNDLAASRILISGWWFFNPQSAIRNPQFQ